MNVEEDLRLGVDGYRLEEEEEGSCVAITDLRILEVIVGKA